MLLRDEPLDEVRDLTHAVMAAPEAAVWHSQANAVLAWFDARSRRAPSWASWHNRIVAWLVNDPNFED